MDQSLHKRIVIISFVSAIFGIVGYVVNLFVESDPLLAASIGILYFSFVISFSSFAIINSEKKWIRKVAKYSLIFYPVILVICVPILMKFNDVSLILGLCLIPLILTIFALMHLFLFDNAISLTGSIFLLFFVLIGIICKRYRLPYNEIPLTLSMCWISIGIFMYGIRCLYVAEKNAYFKYLSFFGCCLIAITFTTLLFKTMHWPIGSILLNISNILMTLGTIVVLVTLPYSGYIDWPVFHKKILRRLLIPWAFIFLLFIFRYLVPEVWTIIWSTGQTAEKHKPNFGMSDYQIQNKSGINPN